MKDKKIRFKIEIIAIELILICALLGVLFVKKVESFNFKDDAYYYYSGIDYIIPAGSVAKVNSNSKVISINRKDDGPLDAIGLPVYMVNSATLVTMKDIAYIGPVNGSAKTGRIPYFTEIRMTEDNLVEISNDTKNSFVNSGFLFDGEDTYVFLEDVTIDFESYHYILPRFSYVVCSKNNWIEFLNYNTKDIEIIPIESDVIVRDNKGVYSVNLISDILEAGSAQIMLKSNLKGYSSYFEEAE